MTKWGKVLFYGTLLWQIPVIWWILYYSQPHTGIIMGLPVALFVFALMYLFYSVVFGYYFAGKYLEDPTGKGIPVDELRKAGGQSDN